MAEGVLKSSFFGKKKIYVAKMAWTAHKEKEDLKEYFEDDETVEKKCVQLAKMIKESKHFIMFTGAGISTGAGIPDYRGPEGVWTLRATGKKRTKKTVSTLQAIPTYTHMAIVELINAGYCKKLFSQNCDGLHRRSGVPRDKISEVHGNSNIERCNKCKREYLRDFGVSRRNKSVRDHRTGRTCDMPNCNGELHDIIINFGEHLDKELLENAFKTARKSDLALAMGSSLIVTPAANIPLTVQRVGNKYVINNLQKTPHDQFAVLKIETKCDFVMKIIMRELKLTPKHFKLKRKLLIEVENNTLKVVGLDYVDSLPFDYLKGVRLNGKKKYSLRKKPFEYKKFSNICKKEKGDKIEVQLFFFSWYGEPPIVFRIDKTVKKVIYNLLYEPIQRKWEMNIVGDKKKEEEKKVEKEKPEEKKVVEKKDDSKVVIEIKDEEEIVIEEKEKKDVEKESKGEEKTKEKVVEKKKEKEIKVEECMIELGNTASPTDKEEKQFKWKFFIKELGTHHIEKIRVVLHKTFHPPEVMLTKKDIVKDGDNDSWVIEKIGWGVFCIKVEVHFVNSNVVYKTDHLLKFDASKTHKKVIKARFIKMI